MPKPFDEDIIQRSIYTIHASSHSIPFERSRDCFRRKLATLVCVGNSLDAILEDRLLEGCYAELGIQRVGYPPRENFPREKIDNRDEVDVTAGEIDVRDIRRPYLIRQPYRLPSQELGVFLMPLNRRRSALTRINGP